MKKVLTYFWRYWFWQMSRLFCFVYLRPKFNLVVKNKEVKIPKRPFFMVSNHGTFFDPWLIGHLSPYPLSIMMNEEGFKAGKFIQWYLKHVGAYPKKKGESDVNAMKYTMKTLRDGYPVLIFPEGQTTWDGQTQPVYGGMENIIKRAKIPLVMMNISGNFMSKPWWSESFRKGKVVVTRKVLSPEDLKEMSKQELSSEIIKFISNNDLRNQELEGTEFVGPPATTGIDRFMWMCRSCGAEDAIVPGGLTVKCSSCGALWEMDTHFNFKESNDKAVEIGNLFDWSQWHKDMVKKNISKAADSDVLTFNEDVDFCDVTDLGEYPVKATGKLSLTKTTLTFEPKGEGKKIELPVEGINDYVFQLKTIFECRSEGVVYKFRFKDKSPMKWVYYFRYLNNYAECEARGYI